VARGRRIEVGYSAARLGVYVHSYCAASEPNFCVAPGDIVTACYEVSSETDARADHFVYGRYDRSASKYQFDDERIGTLRAICVEGNAECAHCFCKYHCAGDCPAKAGFPHRLAGPRCELNRGATIDQIAETLGLPGWGD
jgi:uncharacterized protein